MAKGDLLLGPESSEILLSPFGRKFIVGQIEMSKKRRTADGTLRKDKWAKKKKFTLDYSTITGTAVDYFQTLYDLDSELSFIVYTDIAVYDTYTVMMEPFDKERLVLLSDGLWEDVRIILEEV